MLLFLGEKKKRRREEGKLTRLLLEFCIETLLCTWNTVAGKKPWETYQLGFSCPLPLKSPNSAQDLGPAMTISYCKEKERWGCGEEMENKEEKSGERKEGKEANK